MDRIVIDSKYSMTDNLPLSYVNQIRSLAEVDQVTNMSWFGGYYKELRDSFATYPVDPESYFGTFAEQKISAATLDRFKRIRVLLVGLAVPCCWARSAGCSRRFAQRDCLSPRLCGPEALLRLNHELKSGMAAKAGSTTRPRWMESG